MKLLLINPPIARYDHAELAPPLGLLRVAAHARACTTEATVLDLNLPEHRDAADSSEFYKYVAELVALNAPDEVGITSMGVNSHVSIRLGEEIAQRFKLPVTLGGIHLASIADVVAELAPSIARVATRSLRQTAFGRTQWWGTPGLTEEAASAVALYSNAPLAQYFSGNARHVANWEAGSGCKYNCAFCYSPDHYDGWNARPTEAVSSDFKSLHSLGFEHVFLVDDNLTNSPAWLETLAAELCRNHTGLTWNGYATLPDLDPKVLPLLAESGCINLYLGIDTTNAHQQKEWRKRFFKNQEQASALVVAGTQAGVQLTCAFILDLRAQGDLARESNLECAMTLARKGADIRFSVLAHYPNSAIYDQQSMATCYSEARTAILMDLPLVIVQNPLAPLAPRAFPWHSQPCECQDWESQVLTVAVVQEILVHARTEIRILDCVQTGSELWQLGTNIAQDIQARESFHKTELKAIIRETLDVRLASAQQATRRG